MLTGKAFRRIALGMDGAIEGAHMGHPDFRVNSRIFATLRNKDTLGMVVLTPDQQQTILREHPKAFEPESGAWGRAGCTRVLLQAVDEEALGEAMTFAWRNATSKPPAGRSKASKRSKTPKAARSRTFEELLARYPPEVQDLARGARALLFEVLPRVEETVDSSGPYISYGYGPGYKGVVGYLTIGQKGVKLGVARGASLPDPRKLLQGTGKTHRHVPLGKPADLRAPGLRPLLRAAHAAWRKDRA